MLAGRMVTASPALSTRSGTRSVACQTWPFSSSTVNVPSSRLERVLTCEAIVAASFFSAGASASRFFLRRASLMPNSVSPDFAAGAAAGGEAATEGVAGGGVAGGNGAGRVGAEAGGWSIVDVGGVGRVLLRGQRGERFWWCAPMRQVRVLGR